VAVSLTAPAPARRLALQPADHDEQSTQNRRIFDECCLTSTWEQEHGANKHQKSEDRHDNPALPHSWKTPAPAVALCGKPVNLFVRHFDHLSCGDRTDRCISRCKKSLLPAAHRFHSEGYPWSLSQPCAATASSASLTPPDDEFTRREAAGVERLVTILTFSVSRILQVILPQ
jgi:hypothetical protein